MTMHGTRFVAAAALLGALVLAGCSKEDSSNPAGPGDNNTTEAKVVSWHDTTDGSWYSRIDATSYDSYTYLDFATHDVVEVGDSASDNADWDVAFSRINGKLNGGASGIGGLMGVDLDAGSDSHTSFDSVNAVPAIPEGDWQTDTEHLVIDDLWYSYNPSTHQVGMTGDVFVMYTANGKYAKFYVSDMRDAGMPPNMGQLEVTYVYQPDGSEDLSGVADTMTVDGTSGEVYVSFAAGGAVDVSDPAADANWDFAFFFNMDASTYSIKVNGGISGNAGVGVYPMYLETNDFDSVTEAPVGGGYFADSIESIFGAPTVPGSEWYNYDMNSGRHEIISKQHVYLVKVDAATVYKLQITNYYHPETGMSGYVTVRYQQL